MQATVRTTWFGIDRIKLALVASGLLASTIAGAAAITLIDDDGTVVPPRTTALTMQHRYAETSQYATVRDERAGTASLEANGLPIAPIDLQAGSSGTADLEANGLPVAPVAALDTSAVDRADQLTQYLLSTLARQTALEPAASDHAIWTAFPGHAGFIAPEGEGTVTLTRTYYPGNPGFINP